MRGFTSYGALRRTTCEWRYAKWVDDNVYDTIKKFATTCEATCEHLNKYPTAQIGHDLKNADWLQAVAAFAYAAITTVMTLLPEVRAVVAQLWNAVDAKPSEEGSPDLTFWRQFALLTRIPVLPTTAFRGQNWSQWLLYSHLTLDARQFVAYDNNFPGFTGNPSTDDDARRLVPPHIEMSRDRYFPLARHPYETYYYSPFWHSIFGPGTDPFWKDLRALLLLFPTRTLRDNLRSVVLAYNVETVAASTTRLFRRLAFPPIDIAAPTYAGPIGFGTKPSLTGQPITDDDLSAQI